jgi:hypothetical protein
MQKKIFWVVFMLLGLVADFLLPFCYPFCRMVGRLPQRLVLGREESIWQTARPLKALGQ